MKFYSQNFIEGQAKFNVYADITAYGGTFSMKSKTLGNGYSTVTNVRTVQLGDSGLYLADEIAITGATGGNYNQSSCKFNIENFTVGSTKSYAPIEESGSGAGNFSLEAMAIGMVSKINSASFRSISTRSAVTGSLSVTTYSDSYTHELSLAVNGRTIFDRSSPSLTAITLSTSEVKAIYNAQSTSTTAQGILILETYQGSTLLGSSSYTVTFTLADVPTLTASYSYSNIWAADNKGIQNLSYITITGTCAATEGSGGTLTISYQGQKRSVEINGDFTSELWTCPSAGAYDITVQYDDNRGLSVKTVLNTSIVLRPKPEIDYNQVPTIQYGRAGGDDYFIPATSGADICLIFPLDTTKTNLFTYTPITYATADNPTLRESSISLKHTLKDKTGTVTLIDNAAIEFNEDGTLTKSNYIFSTGLANPDTYNYTITATDGLNDEIINLFKLTTMPPKYTINARPSGQGIAFGGPVAQDDGYFDVYWQPRFSSPLPISSGGTGATTLTEAKQNLGLNARVEGTTLILS